MGQDEIIIEIGQLKVRISPQKAIKTKNENDVVEGVKQGIRQPSWFVLLLLLGYGLIYWLLGYLCFQTCLTYAKKKGSLFHV